MKWKVHVTCNFNFLIETKGLLRVTGSHVHWKNGNIRKTVNKAIVTTEY